VKYNKCISDPNTDTDTLLKSGSKRAWWIQK